MKWIKEHIKHWYPKDGRFFKVLSMAGLISAVDVSYTSAKTGEMVCCEVVTGSYKDLDIQGKEYCGEILQTEVEYVRV